MERPKRIRKPNMRYDPNIYVLATFPKKNKHTILPKHQVTIDAIDEKNGIVKSSGFPQCVRIIAEGSRSKCKERATQFSKNTGSEEVEILPMNNENGDEFYGDDDANININDYNNDDANVNINKNDYNNGDTDYLPPTTDFNLINNLSEQPLDFSVVSGYKDNYKPAKSVSSDDDDEIMDVIENNKNEENSNNIDNPSPTQLMIDECQNHNHEIENVNNVQSNINEGMSEASDCGEDEEITLVSTKKNKRKKKRRSTQLNSNTTGVTEDSNTLKEFMSFRYNVEKRLKNLEKTFRILKSRNILKERNDLMNINESEIQPTSPKPEFVLGVDTAKFNFSYDEHTKFARAIFRQAGYALNPNQVLGNEEMVMAIQNAIKKRDKRLQVDKELFNDTWRQVVESVRQLKHDHKRNTTWRALRAAQQTNTSRPQSETSNDLQSGDIIAESD